MYDRYQKGIWQQAERITGRKGLAQDKLAMKAGLNTSYVGFIERAQRNPTLETINKLASALDVEIQELFDF